MVNDLVAPLTVEDTTFPVAAHRFPQSGGPRGCGNQPAGPWLWSAGRGEGNKTSERWFQPFVRYLTHLDLASAWEVGSLIYRLHDRQTPPSTLRPQTPWRACNNITTGARNATLSTRDRCRRGAKPPPPSIRPRRRPSRKPFVCLGSGRRGGPHRRCTARGPGTAWAPWRRTA